MCLPFSFRTSQGFTLPELVLILVLLGIVSATVLPRFADQSPFLERGTQDQALAAVRHAQKIAVATGCAVQVCVSGGCSASINGVQLNQRLTSCTSGAFTKDVEHPAEPGQPYQVIADSSVAVSASPASFTFDALGQASADATLTIGGSRQIHVVADTGFVYATP